MTLSWILQFLAVYTRPLPSEIYLPGYSLGIILTSVLLGTAVGWMASKRGMKELVRRAEFGRLAASFFHDIANPITAASLHIHELKGTEGKNSDEAKEHIAKAALAIHRLETSVRSIQKQIRDQDNSSHFSLTETP